VGCTWYNDPSIFRLLDSIPKEIDVLVVDGKFTDMVGEPFSDKEMKDKVKNYPNVTVVGYTGSEVDKRNFMMQTIEGLHKYCLIIDSDEWVKMADWPYFYKEICKHDEGILGVRLEFDFGGSGYFGHLWVHPRDWEFYKTHKSYRNKKTNRVVSSGNWGKVHLPGILIRGDDKLRSAEYSAKVEDYQETLWAKQ